MPIAIPWLLDLSFWLFAIGTLIFLTLCVLIVKALFGTASSAVSWIPWVGSAASSGLHRAEQHVVNVFSKGIDKTQATLGWSWHLQARMLDWLGREINSHANLLLLLANQIPGVGLVRSLLAAVHVAEREIGRLWKSIPGTAHGIARPIEGEIKALERWTYPRVKHAVNEVDHVIPKDIAGLRTRTKTIEGELSRAWDAIRAGKLSLTSLAFVGAVALALSRLGLGWLRCNSATQLGKKYGCGLWPKLDSLLGLLGEALLVTNICRVIPWLEEAFSVVASPLISTLAAAGAGLCAPGSSAAPPLDTPHLYLPASPSDALYLP